MALERIQSELYVPAVATQDDEAKEKYGDDLKTRYDLLQPARKEIFQSTGLMLVLLQPEHVEGEFVQRQLDNLDPYRKLNTEDRPVVFAMHSWRPLTGTTESPLNFLTNGSWSREYVEKSIDFMSEIPDDLAPPSGRAVTFHLSTYVTPDQWKKELNEWDDDFKEVIRHIRELTEYGQRYGVNVHIENVPVPPFGDWLPSKDSKFTHKPFHFRDLGTPWPGLPWRDEVKAFRDAGARMTVDWCHLEVALDSVREVASLARNGFRNEALSAYMFFESDLIHENAVDEFAKQALLITKPGDIVHAVQSADKYQTTRLGLHNTDQTFVDSASLSDPEGNIPVDQLKKLIKTNLGMPVKFVLEAMETDFKNNPNTKASLDLVLSMAQEL